MRLNTRTKNTVGASAVLQKTSWVPETHRVRLWMNSACKENIHNRLTGTDAVISSVKRIFAESVEKKTSKAVEHLKLMRTSGLAERHV